MAIPSEKSHEMEAFIDNMLRSLGRTESIKNNQCVWCQKPAVTFKDELSKKEYTISGMCQDCQDRTFGGE